MQTLRTNCRRTALALAAACLLSTPVLAHPGSGIAVDRLGQVYFLDTGSGLWKIDAHGKLARISGTMFHWLALDANDRFANARLPSGPDWEISRVGANPMLLLSSDFPIAIGQDGNLDYPSGPPSGLRIMRMIPSGGTSVLATLPATTSGPLPHINGITAGPDDSLYYTENSAIRRITAQGRVSTRCDDPRSRRFAVDSGDRSRRRPVPPRPRGQRQWCGLRGGQRVRPRAEDHARRQGHHADSDPEPVVAHSGRPLRQ